MARPFKTDSEKRAVQVMLTLTLEEADRLKKQAEIAAMPLAVFAREAALQSRITVRKGRALSPETFIELNRVGVNLNQIAKAANAGRPIDPEAVSAALERVNALLDQGIE